MRKWVLLGIIILGFLLRVMGLESYPVGFTPDEASFGYDAYSIIKTGADQWGHKFPLVLKSFGDYKSALYSYLLIPGVWLLGLTKEAVRLPNAIFGSLAVLVVYFLVKSLFGSTKTALASSFLLAVSSWHVIMSRGGFEANLATFFLPLGILFLIKSLKSSKYLYLGSFILGLNLFSYHTAKVVTPLVVACFVFLFRKEFLSLNKKTLMIASAIFLFFLGLTGYTLLNGAATRAKDINIFNGSLEESFSDRQSIQVLGVSPVFARILYNKYGVGVSRFVGNYISYFSPQFLFTAGPAEATYGMIPGRGVLYWFELPFLTLFLVSFVRAKDKRNYWLVLLWILAAPVPAALATGPGYAGNRSVIMLPAMQIALGLGFVQFLDYFKSKWIRIGYAVFAFLCFALFFTDYFIASPAKTAQSMLYGNLEAATWLNKNVAKNANIVVDRVLSEPHIYVAFANKWDPADYQKEAQNWKLGSGISWVDQIPEYKLGNYVFKAVHPEEYSKTKDIYLVSKPDAFAKNSSFLKVFNYPNGRPAIEILKI